MKEFNIRRCDGGIDEARALTELTVEIVESGGSIGFMMPASRREILAFWQECQESASREERVLLVAEEMGSRELVGTVQVVFAVYENQRHRADIAKMQVRRRVRRRGLGGLLMRAAEEAAFDAGRWLLILDAVPGSAAERLYLRMGWTRVGEVPSYALLPAGGYCDTAFFYKILQREDVGCVDHQ